MKKIAIIGSTELARQLLHFFESTNFADVVGLFDDHESPGATRHDRRVLGKRSDARALFKKGVFDAAAIGVGYKDRRFRQKAYEDLTREQIPVVTFIHPESHVDRSAKIGDGCILLPGCMVLMNAVLEQNVLLSAGSLVNHDAKIGAHTYCAPATNLAGYVEVGERCFIGIGTTVIDYISIGSGAQTAGGSVVTRDVPPEVLVAGVPARVKKQLSAE